MALFKEKLMALVSESSEKQKEFFQKRFIFKLSHDQFYEVETLYLMFRVACENDDKKDSLSLAGAAAFLGKLKATRTAQQLKSELADFDLNSDRRMSFIEFLCLHFKALVLGEFFARKSETPDIDLSGDLIGLTGVGDRIIEELFAPPQGQDPDLEANMRAFAKHHVDRANKIKDLDVIIEAGGVKAMNAKSEKAKLEHEDGSEMHLLEARIKNAIVKLDKAADAKIAEAKADSAAAAKAVEDQKKRGLSGKV